MGDTVRTPIIQQIIKDIYGMDISRTLAPDECHARGATLYAAMSSPYFSLKDFDFQHCNPYTIQFEYPFVKDGNLEIRNTKIISKGENLPNRKSIKFNEKQLPKQNMLEMKLMYNKDEPNIKDALLKTYQIVLPQKMDEQFTFSLQFLQDSNGLPHIDKASIIEVKWEEKEVVTSKADAKKDAKSGDKKEVPKEDAKNDTNMKDATAPEKKEEKKTEKVKTETSQACQIKLIEIKYGIDQLCLDNVIKNEGVLENDDRLLNYAFDKRNDMETYIYTTKEKLEDVLAPYIDGKDREALMQVMNEIKQWFESEAPEITVKSHIDEKYTALSTHGDRVYKRRTDWENLEQSLPNLEGAINQQIKRVEEEFNKLQANQACNLTKENVEECKKAIEEFNEIHSNSLSKLTKTSKFIDPPVSWEAINRHIKEFNDKINKVFIDAEKRVKDELKKLEKERKEQAAAEKAKQEEAKKTEKPAENNKMEVD